MLEKLPKPNSLGIRKDTFTCDGRETQVRYKFDEKSQDFKLVDLRESWEEIDEDGLLKLNKQTYTSDLNGNWQPKTRWESVTGRNGFVLWKVGKNV